MCSSEVELGALRGVGVDCHGECGWRNRRGKVCTICCRLMNDQGITCRHVLFPWFRTSHSVTGGGVRMLKALGREKELSSSREISFPWGHTSSHTTGIIKSSAGKLLREILSEKWSGRNGDDSWNPSPETRASMAGIDGRKFASSAGWTRLIKLDFKHCAAGPGELLPTGSGLKWKVLSDHRHKRCPNSNVCLGFGVRSRPHAETTRVLAAH